MKPWRESFERNHFGPKSKETLAKLRNKYREVDRYQIQEAFPEISVSLLNAALDDLNWIGLELTKPEGPIYYALIEKLESLKKNIEALKDIGYFVDVEPERFRRYVEMFGEEKAKLIFR